MYSNVFKCSQMFPKVVKCSQTFSKGLKRFETVFKRSQEHVKAFMAPRTTQTYPNPHTSHRNCFQNVQRY